MNNRLGLKCSSLRLGGLDGRTYSADPGPKNVRFLPTISGRLICAHSLIPHSAKTYEFSARGASGEKRMSFPFLSRHLSVL
jgi:hypothetical protein